MAKYAPYKPFEIRQSKDFITPIGGMSFVGHALLKWCKIRQALDPKNPIRNGGLPLSAIIQAYIGLLCQGKSDFEAIENFRKDPFFASALGLAVVPSSVSLRQKLDDYATPEVFEQVAMLNIPLLKNGKAVFSTTFTGHVPLDLDTTCHDNSGSKKEHIGRTYLGCDGYTAMNAFCGTEGYCLLSELRPGTEHCANEFSYVLERAISRAKALVAESLLLRLDSGFCSLITFLEAMKNQIDFICKWNPRGWLKKINMILDEGKKSDQYDVQKPREGKIVHRFRLPVKVKTKNKEEFTLWRYFRIEERHSLKNGQQLLLPEFNLDAWTSNLDLALEKIEALYCEHATMEQFHSEIKTDLDLERFPSGKFNTNFLVLTLASIAYNILRLMGQQGMLQEDSPIRRKAKRRRLKTVIQELVYCAARFWSHAGKVALEFGRAWRGFACYTRLYEEWRAYAT